MGPQDIILSDISSQKQALCGCTWTSQSHRDKEEYRLPKFGSYCAMLESSVIKIKTSRGR